MFGAGWAVLGPVLADVQDRAGQQPSHSPHAPPLPWCQRTCCFDQAACVPRGEPLNPLDQKPKPYCGAGRDRTSQRGP
jgi:hypothetical protein